ncbi:hypothetical protein BaRGS_00040094 [Batillaria attramentaria]|uniref:Uncharacterized protein n=1 Tax=Batillaria attramentaria TaxID=370345 RepID=A0ABD0J135_9CAEN
MDDSFGRTYLNGGANLCLKQSNSADCLRAMSFTPAVAGGDGVPKRGLENLTLFKAAMQFTNFALPIQVLVLKGRLRGDSSTSNKVLVTFMGRSTIR